MKPQHESTLADLDTVVVIVTFEASPFAQAYVEETGIRWPVLVDQTRSLYHAYGILRGRIWDIWVPRDVNRSSALPTCFGIRQRVPRPGPGRLPPL